MNVREEFEAWHKKEVAAFMGAGLTKAAQHMRDFKETMAAVWEASREAMVIELPEPFAVIGDYAACGGGKAVWDLDYSEKIDDRMCKKTSVYDRECLEAAGLKVAP